MAKLGNKNELMDMQYRVLIIDDDEDFTESMKELLEHNKYVITVANDVFQAEALLRVCNAQVALIDIRLGKHSGIDLIHRLKSINPRIACIMITAFSAMETVVEALRSGAYDYLTKPCQPLELIATMERCFDHVRLANLQDVIDLDRAQVTLASIGDAVISTDTDCNIEYMNPAAEALTGWRYHDAKGAKLENVFNIVNEFSREPASNPVQRCLMEDRIVGLANHTTLIGKDGREVSIEDSAAPIRNQRGHVVGVVLVFHDVTQARRLAQQVTYQTTHDSVTGLANQKEFRRSIQSAIEKTHIEKKEYFLLCITLQDFMRIQRQGQIAVNEYVRGIANVLKKTHGFIHKVARIDDNSFGMIIMEKNPQNAQTYADHLLNRLHDFALDWEGVTYSSSVNIGIVVIDQYSQGLSRVTTLVDIACQLAQQSGENKTYLYQHGDEQHLDDVAGFADLKRMTQHIRDGNIYLYKQSVISFSTELPKEEYLEVYARLKNSKEQLLLPSSFLPMANRQNLTAQLDRWVTQKTFAWLYQRVMAGNPVKMCFINLGVQTIEDLSFLDFLKGLLIQMPGLEANVCFETAESEISSHFTKALDFIVAVKKMGFRFGLDDFGIGFSSFTYLEKTPVDYIKIDGSLIKDIAKSEIRLTVVKSIHDIAQIMRIKTIAEHVENQEDLKQLKEIGIDYGQGYGLAEVVALL